MNKTVIDEYIEKYPVDIQERLFKVREAILKAIPNAKEKISWQMPTFYLEKNIMHFAAFKNHLGVYPGASAIIHFADKLKNYKTSKGAIQFQYREEVPYLLIEEITRWCYENNKRHGL